MKHACAMPLYAMVLVLVVATGCGDDDGPTTSSGSSSNLSESEAIGIVKGHLAMVSQPGTESRSVPRSVPCPLGSTDPLCVPCAPGSNNLCRTEWVTENVAGQPRCPFPPGPQANWTAEYDEYNATWAVESSELATGRNQWIVDDQSASILSGYCHP